MKVFLIALVVMVLLAVAAILWGARGTEMTAEEYVATTCMKLQPYEATAPATWLARQTPWTRPTATNTGTLS